MASTEEGKWTPSDVLRRFLHSPANSMSEMDSAYVSQIHTGMMEHKGGLCPMTYPPLGRDIMMTSIFLFLMAKFEQARQFSLTRNFKHLDTFSGDQWDAKLALAGCKSERLDVYYLSESKETGAKFLQDFETFIRSQQPDLIKMLTVHNTAQFIFGTGAKKSYRFNLSVFPLSTTSFRGIMPDHIIMDVPPMGAMQELAKEHVKAFSSLSKLYQITIDLNVDNLSQPALEQQKEQAKADDIVNGSKMS